MSINTAQFVELLKSAGYDPHSYSGRAMYGEKCVAITEYNDDGEWRSLSDRDMVMLGWRLAQTAIAELEDEWAVDSVGRPLAQTRTDGMGRGIVVYWPSEAWTDDLVAVVPDEEGDEDEF